MTSIVFYSIVFFSFLALGFICWLLSIKWMYCNLCLLTDACEIYILLNTGSESPDFLSTNAFIRWRIIIIYNTTEDFSIEINYCPLNIRGMYFDVRFFMLIFLNIQYVHMYELKIHIQKVCKNISFPVYVFYFLSVCFFLCKCMLCPMPIEIWIHKQASATMLSGSLLKS